MRTRALLPIAGLVACTLSAPAFAQGDAAKLEQATQLYEEATKLLDNKRFDEACPKLEQAVELVPVASGAQLALGICYEGKGKLGSAYLKYEEAAALARAAGQPDREQRAREALASLGPRIARLTVEPSAATRSAEGFVVTLDGVRLAPAAWGAARPVDAGEHRLHAEAPGHAPFDAKVSIVDGENKALKFELGRAASTPTGSAPPQEPSSAPTEPPTEAPTEESGGSPVRTAGYVVGGVGVAGLVVGAVTGGMAIGKKSDGDVGCDGNVCPQPALDARDEGFTLATISTIGFIAGGALLAGGVVLFVVGGDGEGGAQSAHLRTEARPGGLVVSGAF